MTWEQQWAVAMLLLVVLWGAYGAWKTRGM